MSLTKRKTVLFTMVLFLAFMIFYSSGVCLAQGDQEDDVDLQAIEMLDATDVEKAIDLMKQDYYDPLDSQKLLKEFVEGVHKYAKKENKKDPFENLKLGNSFKDNIKAMDKAFKDSGLRQGKWQKYIQEGLRYMVNSLNNEGCEYYPPGRYRATLQEMGYNKGGCGFFVDEKKRDSDGRWMIIETLQDFPAEKEGIKPGDRLISVNSHDVRKLSFKELAKVVRGPIGSQVELLVYRPSAKKEVTIDIKRTWLGPNPKSVKTRVLPGNIGYIKFRYLGERMDSTIQDIYKDFEKKNVKGVIWDMRNSAGIMEGATGLAAYYAPLKKVFAWRVFLDGKSRYDGMDPAMKCKPDVILINKYSSHTCIFVALVLKEYHKIPIVGRPMEWDGDDTKSFRLRDDSYIRITFSYYKLANGKVLKNGEEIKPDTDVGQHPLPPYTRGDKQLEKAVDMVKAK